MKLNVGDWVFFEHELMIVEEVTDSGAGSCTLSSGTHSVGCHNAGERCRPLTKTQKQIADGYHAVRMELHRVDGSHHINFPDVCRWIEHEWLSASEDGRDDKSIRDHFNRLYEFKNNVLKKLQDLRFEEVMGVRVLR